MTGHLPLLVGIEIDPERLPGGKPASTIDRNGAEQLLAHLSTDLADGLPGVRQCSLAIAGALYDPTEVLRPGYPLFAAMAQLQRESGDQGPRLLSIGADAGRMPVDALQPVADVPRGALQLLVLSLAGDADDLASLSDDAEYRLMEEGQLSAHAAKGVEAQFGLACAHARFMTLTDLQAMLRMQLEHFGFLPLWELLEAALEARETPLRVEGRQGQCFEWTGEAVRARFETFDYWARHGAGSDVTGDDGALGDAYGAWTRGYRQFLVTLRAHGVALVQHLPGSDAALEGSFLVEDAGPDSRSDEVAGITEHSCAEMGMIAVTVMDGGRRLNYYPLAATGVEELHTRIRAANHDEGLAFPGKLLFDPETRQLAADTL